MRNIAITLEYDGTDFVGWQIQPNGRSIQEAIEKALATLLGEPVRVTASGRTDAGVHAKAQVATFRTGHRIPLRGLVLGMNSILPADVSVAEAREVDPDFDARRSASGKRYVYRISNRPTRSALRRRSHWEVFSPLDLRAMREAAALLLGTHDFAAFRAADCNAATTVRQLRRLEVVEGDDREVLVIAEATAFLKHMVRNLVGTLVEVGQGKRDASSMTELLRSRNRTLAGRTAPPQGLILDEVFYGERVSGAHDEVESGFDPGDP